MSRGDKKLDGDTFSLDKVSGGTHMPRKKCPGGHFILGFCVRGGHYLLLHRLGTTEQ